MFKSIEETFAIQDEAATNELKVALAGLDKIPDSFYGLVWLYDHDFLYVSPTIEKVTGHSYTDFFDKSLLFFQSITPYRMVNFIFGFLQDFLVKLEAHPQHVKAPMLSKLNAALTHADGYEIPILHTAAFIDFKKQKPTPYLILGVWLDTSGKTPQQLERIGTRIDDALLTIKRLYQKHCVVIIDNVTITKRERQVLTLLASGQSTKKVSETLGISFHTVETHRKNLLHKFQANNTAELVKKAVDLIK